MHLPELHALSVQLLSSLDECMEMAGVVDGEPQSPQAGFVFEEMAEVNIIAKFVIFICVIYIYSLRSLMCMPTMQIPTVIQLMLYKSYWRMLRPKSTLRLYKSYSVCA